MGIIAKYKFNQNTYADFIPTFNSEFTDYTITDEIDTDGYTIRTISNDSGVLPTIMQFGNSSNTSKTKSLLNVYKCNTSEITNMAYMFSNCRYLTSLDLSGFNTENVKSMDYMFYYCHGLTSLNLSSFNTEKVISMSRMFSNCINLTSLNLSNFNTYQVTNMQNMFYNCSSLTSLDISNFNTENVTNMSQTFAKCSSLTSLDVSNFNTEKVTNTTSIFESWTSSQKVYISSKWTLGRDFPPTFIIAFAYTIAKYKFNQNTYENFIPTFNSTFTDYKYNDETDTDGFTIRTLGNDSGSLPTLMRFGTTTSQTNREKSLLEVFECYTNKITDMSYMFYGCSNLTSLDLSNFNTQNVTDMNRMFNSCSKLISLDLSGFNTQKVTTMSNMFNGCSKLTSLNLSSFNTEKVTTMSYMFNSCSKLTSLDISSFNTENVNNMSYMFYNCKYLTSLNISNFNTQNATTMSSMFNGCSKLTSLDISSFNTEKVTSMSYMFCNCSSLTSLDLKSFNTEKVTNSTSMFESWTSEQKVYITSKWTLGTDFPPTFIIAFAYTIAKYKFNQNIYANFLPIFNTDFTDYIYNDEIDTDGYTIRTVGNDSGSLPTLMRFGQEWITGESGATDKSKSLLEVYECDTSNITNMNDMFRYCNNLISLIASNFNTSKVTGMSQMFQNCTSLASLDLSSFNTSQVANMGYMFQNCSSLTSLNVSNFNTQNVTNMVNMFTNCSKLTSLDVSSFNVSEVRNMTYMFAYCSSLTSLDLSNFNTINATGVNSMFNNCSALTSLDLSNFNTEKVDNMTTMFNKCSSLISLDLSSFNTDKVANMSFMFQSCSSLTSLNVSSFNTSSVTTMNGMFNGCSSLTSLDVSNFNTDKVSNMTYMFSGCSNLTSLDISNFNTSQATNMSYMFNNCSSLTLLDISNFKIDKNPSIDSIFNNINSIENIGMIYCSNTVINYLTQGLDGISVNIWYSNSDLSELTQRNYITFKEYKINILESDEEINLRSIDGVYDELNLETGELTQRIGKIILNGSENWQYAKNTDETFRFNLPISDFKDYGEHSYGKNLINNKLPKVSFSVDGNRHGVSTWRNHVVFFTEHTNVNDFKQWLSQNPITVQYEFATPVIKTINLKGKPSIDWQGDAYIYLENNTLYPQLDCEIESINYYEIPKLKANTLYTLRYEGEPTQCIFGGLTYETENNMILTSGSSDNLLYFDKEVRNIILIEGDVRDRNFDYFEGIESLGAVEIITHKSDMTTFSKVQLPPHIQLHRLPDGTCDELDIKTGILTRNVGYLVLDGSEDELWNNGLANSYPTEANTKAMCLPKSFIELPSIDKNKTNILVTYFKPLSIGYTNNQGYEVMSISSHNDYHIQFVKQGVSTLTKWREYLSQNPVTICYKQQASTTEQLILNYNNSCNYGLILPKGTSDNYNVITNEYKQNINFISIDGSITFDTATIKDTTVKYSIVLSKFDVDATNIKGNDGIYCSNDLFKYEVSDNDYEHAYIENDTTLHVYINKSRLNSYDQVGFQLYLIDNPFDLYYAMRNPIISYINYEDLDPEKASWEMLDCTEDGSITIESGNMDKTLLSDCMNYIAPTKNRFEVNLLKPNTQYTVYVEGISDIVQLNFGGNIVNFASGNIYTSGETQLVEFYTDNEIKNLIIIEGDTRNETINFFEGLKSSENIIVISSNSSHVFGKGGKIQ